ncbi:YnbE family lipoprotein [Caenibius sp. WL]|nr:YnbE family lipoprotein [Caenibius sp. WL]
MTSVELTERKPAATCRARQGRQQAMHRSLGGTMGAVALLIGGAMAMTGCVSVSAPDKPIVIELNINIKQEVVYKLDKGVQDMIDQNAGIF